MLTVTPPVSEMSSPHTQCRWITTLHTHTHTHTHTLPITTVTIKFFAHPKKKKEREKMATSRDVDRHFRGPGRQKSWRKGKTSGDTTRKCSRGSTVTFNKDSPSKTKAGSFRGRRPWTETSACVFCPYLRLLERLSSVSLVTTTWVEPPWLSSCMTSICDTQTHTST